MSLTILSVAYPLAPVRPDTAGGAEQVLLMLDAGIEEAGCHSLVIAPAGSEIVGQLLPVSRFYGILDDDKKKKAQADNRKAIEKALQKFKVSLIHMHGIDFLDYLPPPGIPVLVTLHLPLTWYPQKIFEINRPQTYLHCVSRAQHETSPSPQKLLAPITNGVHADKLALRITKRNYAIALGRVCPEKGFHIALEAASHAGMPLLLGGQVFRYKEHERYFIEEIMPRMKGKKHHFLGPLDFPRKRRFLNAARCLLVSSLVEETSCLAAMEALACGTPVIAFPLDALKKIIENEKNGFLVQNEKEMARAMWAAGSLDSEYCRESVRNRFSADRMINEYLDLYKKLAHNQETV